MIEASATAPPLRVLHVIPTLDPRRGGPVSALVGLASAQVKLGIDVSVLSTFRGDLEQSAVDSLRRQNVKVHLVGPCRTSFLWHPDLKAAARTQVRGADIVHIHAVWQEIQHHVATACRATGTPYIFRPCGMLDPWSLRQSKWKKKLYLAWRLRADLNGAAALHFTAEQERNLAAPLKLKPSAIVEPNGIDLGEFENLPPKGTFRKQYPEIGNSPLLVFLSRVHPKKGLDLLLPAFADLLRRYNALPAAGRPFLVIAGPGEPDYVASLEKRVRELDVADRVLFTGMLHGPERIPPLVDADLFVLPSHQENFGIAVVEALAAGTPVLISHHVNIYQAIVDAGIGVAVPLEVKELTEELARSLAGQAKQRSLMSSECQSFVSKNYSWTAIARRWARNYHKLLLSKSSRTEG